MIYIGNILSTVGIILLIYGNFFLDLFLLRMKFYMLHFTNFILNLYFFAIKLEYRSCEMTGCLQTKLGFSFNKCDAGIMFNKLF